MTPKHALYLHIPFCRHRCAYCDFNTYAGQEGSTSAYVDALCNEIRFVGRSAPPGMCIHTVFFGGGTPTLLNAIQFEAILNSISNSFMLSADVETTTEANPGTVTHAELDRLRALGINRLSFGVQSANVEELHQLERQHDFFDVIRAVTWARRAGFDNLNLDLIYGLPEQRPETWQSTVRRILDLRPEHISAYALTLEHGTPFGRWSARGLMPLPDPDLAADMYDWAGSAFEAAGYAQYEISNWAKPGRECRHNLQYWRGLPYLGLGAGAHGYAGDYRYSNVLRIKTYIDRLMDPRPAAPDFPLSPAAVNQHRQTGADEMAEFMMTGLRLTHEGISGAEFRARFHEDLEARFAAEIRDLTHLGLLECEADRLRLTRRGRLLGNQVFMRFVE
jgi:oxygen-independent coproporphyrinogen-3 oxidase